MMKFLVVLGLILTFFSYAQAEPGYEEAMSYFVEREKKSKKNRGSYGSYSKKREKKRLGAASVAFGKRQKFFILAGFEKGDLPLESTRLLGLGLALNSSKWLQSNLSLEWRSDAERSENNSVAFMYGIQASSALFYFGPELAFGAGRAWGPSEGKSFTSLKAGLNLSNPWLKRFMFSFSLYYRRDQFLNESFHDDRFGALIRFGF